MKHLGDITRISGYEAPAVDCVIGGSPCQDLSIAGRREGLAGARSGLFMEQIRIVKELRERDRESGRTGDAVRPRYMVWENVPGALSSNKGRDFQAVLTEIVRIAEPGAPDVPLPDKGRWPVADAYYGDGWSIAYRILDAQFWGVPQRRRRIALVADLGGRSAPEILFERLGLRGDPEEEQEERETTPVGAGGGAGDAVALRMRAGCEGGGKGALLQVEKSGTLGCSNDQTIFCAGFKAGQGEKAGGIGYQEEVSPTLASSDSGTNRTPAVMVTGQMNDGTGETYQKVAGTLSPGAHPGSYNGQDAYNDMLIVAAVDCRNGRENETTNGTLQAKGTGGTSYNLQNVCRVGRVVRRLTPMECERLQGYPDGWTDIGAWTDSKGKLHKESSDSARCRALGNSIAIPPWKWVLKRICAQYERDATMASLFDGIGGFPMIWEQINGRGSCLWASEIEEFPMAVTKRRFGEG